MKKLISTNPANNYEIIWEVNVSTDEEIKEKVKQANNAKKAWKELWLKERIKLIEPICKEFEERKNEIAELITKETWKTINESVWEVEWNIWEFKWYLLNIERAIKDEITFEDEKSIHKIIYEPIWTTVIIIPWNFAFWLSVWSIIPNLLVWNTVVFKISEECPLLWKLIEEIIKNAWLPKWVFSEVYWSWEEWDKLVNEKIDFICFTWSTKIGRYLYELSAKKFIKLSLEMWGSDPCVVFDNKVKSYLETVLVWRFHNNWQSCSAIKRLIVHEDIFDEVVEKLKNLILEKNILNSNNKKADFWSLVSKKQKILLEEQFEDAINLWANLIIDKEIPDDLKWAYFWAKILTNISKDMKVWKEEVFWPILPIVKFKTEDEAIELANDTIYWLWARVISDDLEQAKRVASKIEAGTVEINNWNRWISENPFGWYKQSWIWRGNWIMWLRELCQIKVISMDK